MNIRLLSATTATAALVVGLTGCGSDTDPVADAKASQAVEVLEESQSATEPARLKAIKDSCTELIEKRAANSGGELAGRSHKKLTPYSVSHIEFTGVPELHEPAGKITTRYWDIPVSYTVTPQGGSAEVSEDVCRFNEETNEATEIR